jgi:hypothetical protein
LGVEALLIRSKIPDAGRVDVARDDTAIGSELDVCHCCSMTSQGMHALASANVEDANISVCASGGNDRRVECDLVYGTLKHIW